MNAELRARLFANDRLLKALIALLAEREPELLSELREVFSHAEEKGNEIADNTRATWAEINRELDLIEDMAGFKDEPVPKRASGNH